MAATDPKPFYGPFPFHIEKVYRGERTDRGAAVVVHERNLERKLRHVVHHSPTGFEWGYLGSGPADLARSLLIDFLGFDPAPAFYQAFKSAVIARLEHDAWALNPEQLREAFRAIAAELDVSCLRCLDEGVVGDGARLLRCPTCHGQSAPERAAEVDPEQEAI